MLGADAVVMRMVVRVGASEAEREGRAIEVVTLAVGH